MIPVERAHLNVAVTTHPGMSGKNNEDRYGISAFRQPNGPGLPAVFAVVADGIGGHRAGEVAAEMAVEIISRAIAASDGSQPVQTLQQAVMQASQAIYQQAEADPILKSMGSTCACVWVIGDRLYTASVGDSRIYLARAGVIAQLTTDHTWVQEAMDNGMLNADQARRHPNAHVIRRYLGSRQPVVPDLRLRLRGGENDARAEANQGMHLLPGDCVLICSDGLTDLVEDTEILGLLNTYGPENAPDELVKLANQRGGHDNITIVTMQTPARVPAPTVVPPTRRSWRALWPSCLVAVGLLVIAALLFGGVYWFVLRPPAGATPTPTSNPAVEATLFPGEAEPLTPVAPAGGSSSATPFAPRPTARTVLTAAANSEPGGPTLTPWPTNTLIP